ncbi:pyrroline-5-carboxylate reductase family protein [Nanoarchaeota archaeon]
MRIAVIGAGNLGGKIIESLSGHDIIATSKDLKKIEQDVEKTSDNAFAVKKSDVVILAVKPQQIEEVCKEIAPFVDDKLVISFAAAVKLEKLKEWLNSDRVVRMMTGIFVKDEIQCYCPDDEIIQEIFPDAILTNEDGIDCRAYIGTRPGILPMELEVEIAELAKNGLTEEQAREIYGAMLIAIGKNMKKGMKGPDFMKQVTGGHEESFTARLHKHLEDEGYFEILKKSIKKSIESMKD